MSRSKLSTPVPITLSVVDGRRPLAEGEAASPVLLGSEVPLRMSRLYEVGKRLFDVAFCLIMLVPLIPLLMLLALAVKLASGGPVLFHREAVGRNGKVFYLLKFRTMIPSADEYLAARPELLSRYLLHVKLQDDPRVTRLGRLLRRTSLDELPQFFNVLRGQMSLVGPRPLHPSEVERFGEFARIRQQVQPGITGLWQVSGRSALSYEERIELDREHVQKCSFWWDLKILLRTVPAVLGGDGAY